MARTIRDVMTKVVVVAPVSAGYIDLVRLLHDHHVSAVPIVDGDGAILGLVSESDLLLKRDPELHEWHLFEGPHRRTERRKAEARTARDLMTAPAVTIGPDARPSDAAHLMRERGLKHLPVVDERGHVLGIVSRVDLLASFLRGDDAIADDARAVVRDEGAQADDVWVEAHDGVVRLAGRVPFRSVRERIVERVRRVEGVVAAEADGLDHEEDDTIAPVSPVPWVGF
jgi:CBS domain-containing protein